MKRSPYLPLLAIFAVAIGGVATTLATDSRPGLGLDLQGGVSVVLEPVGKVSTEQLDKTIGIIRRRVDAFGAAEPDIARQGTAIVVQIPGIKDQERALAVVGKTAELRFRPVIQALPSEDAMRAQEVLNKSTTTTKAGATTTTAKGATTVPGTATTVAGGTSTTAVGATTTAPAATTAASTTVGTTAVATTLPVTSTTAAPGFEAAPAGGFGAFAIAAQTATTKVATAVTTATTTPGATPTTKLGTATTKAGAPTTIITGATQPTPSVVQPNDAVAAATANAAASATCVPTNPPQIPANFITTPIDKDQKDAYVILPENDNKSSSDRLYLAPSLLTGEIVSDARAELDATGQWQVIADFTGRGSNQWDDMAALCINQRIAIVLDGVVESAPTIQVAKFNGSAQITGTFTESEAKDLATSLKFGSLPVQLKTQTVQTVSATLGRDSLDAGLLAGFVGLGLVALYMIFYYRTLGLVVVSGLCMSGALMWSLVTWLSASRGIALSLSGAVGIIVSVGVTVDSYVVYFERMRDEIRAGKTVKSAVDRGFKGAWHTIRTADLTSIIGAFVLYILTVGSVRGFAFFLMLSTFLDIIVTYMFTRPFVKLLGNKGWFSPRTLGVDKFLATSEISGSTDVLRPGSSNASTGARS